MNKDRLLIVFLLLLIVSLHVLLLIKLVFFPYPELFIYPYLTSNGVLPYKQIFDQHFPGLLFFPINFYTLGMTTPEVARYWQIGVVVGTHLLLFLTTISIVKNKFKALFSNFLYFIIHPYFEGYALWIDSFVPLLLIPGFLLLWKWDSKQNNYKKLFMVGILLGLALIFKQTVLPLTVLVAAYIYFRSRNVKCVLVYILGFGLPSLLMIFYLLNLGVLNEFFYWTVTFNLTTFADMGRTYPAFPVLIRVLPFFALPIALILTKARQDNKIAIFAIFIFGSLVFAFARFDYIHLQPTIPFLVLSTVYSVFKLKIKYAHLILILFMLYSSVFFLRTIQRFSGNSIFFFGNEELKIAEKVVSYNDDNGSVFSFASVPHLNYLTKTLPPGKVFVFPFPWFSIEAEDKVLEGIMLDPPKVVARDTKATTGGVNMVSYMPKINKYIEEYYTVVDNIGNTEIMIPK